MTDEAQEREDHVELAGRLARGVVHEVNSPLTLVLTCLGVLREEVGRLEPALASSLNELVADADDGAERVHELLRAFQAIARPRSSRPASVDLDREVARALLLLRRELEVHARLDVELGSGTLEPVEGGVHHALAELFAAVAGAVSSGPVMVRTSLAHGESGAPIGELVVTYRGAPPPERSGGHLDASIRNGDLTYAVERPGEGSGAGPISLRLAWKAPSA